MESTINPDDPRKKLIDRIFKKCIEFTNTTLSSLNHNGVLLQSDSSYGLSEININMLLFNNLIMQNEYKTSKSFMVDIEKNLSPGKRCDLFIKTKFNDILIIEVKYVKISFLEEIIKGYSDSQTLNEKLALYSKMSRKISGLSKDEITQMKRLAVYNKSLTDKPLTNKYESIQEVLDNALIQAKGYAQTQSQYKFDNIYYCVVAGIGTTIIASDLILYKNT